MNQHWAFPLIGKEYTDGTDGRSTDGPDTFNCWGLVRWCFVQERNIQMPLIPVGRNLREDRAEAIRQVEDATGWRRSYDHVPRDWDIAVMHSADGRHVGLVLVVNGGVHLLHALEGVGVILTPIGELWMFALSNITLWRQA